MSRVVDKITKELFQEYGNRKRPNRLDFIVNVRTGLHYPIPKDVEHADFIPNLGFPRTGVIVPYWMTLLNIDDKLCLERLVFGASSYEAIHGVRHSPLELATARNLAWELILNSPEVDYTTIDSDETFKTFADYDSKK